MADDCAHATLGASQHCSENRKGDVAAASRRSHRGQADQQQRQAQQGGYGARGKGANGLVGRAPSWAEAGWHPMAVMVASGQLRNGGTGVYIPGAARPKSVTAPGGSEGSSPHAPSASPEASSPPASPASGSPPRNNGALGGHSTSSNISGAGTVRVMSQEWGASLSTHDENLVGSFPPLKRGPRSSIDVPRPPPPRNSVGAAPGLQSPPNAGERAAHAAAAAAAAVDAAAQALAAAQAAAAVAASEPTPATANTAETLALQVALLQLQQQQVQLQQLQQQQGLQQLQQEALLHQMLVTAGPQLQATAQPHPPMMSGDSVWSNASFFPAADAPFSPPSGPAHGGSVLSGVPCSPSTFDTATFCSGLPSPAFNITAPQLSGSTALYNTQVLSTGDEPVLLGAFNLRRSPGYW